MQEIKIEEMLYNCSWKNDWCHFCGERDEMYFTEIIIPKNAEHDISAKGGTYLRLCKGCIDLMSHNANLAASRNYRSSNELAN